MSRKQKIKIKVDDEKYMPEKAHDQDACFDLKAKVGREVDIAPGEVVTIDTGVRLELPSDWEALIRPRSGLASKFGLTVVNSPGTIDSGYRGEIKVVLGNTQIMKKNPSFSYVAKNHSPVNIKDGMRIAQIAFRKVPKVYLEVVEEVTVTERGEGGFGSTGV
jgi:dUTP pyrophosphatase